MAGGDRGHGGTRRFVLGDATLQLVEKLLAGKDPVQHELNPDGPAEATSATPLSP